MCGISGWVGPEALGSNTIDAIQRSLSHRGPDDEGRFVDGAAGVGLLHRRLSIIDLSALGRQPMTNEDGSLVLCFNGEIYNFAELRPELEGRGHVFRSRTDSEVLLHGWEAWGEGLLDRVRGMFAFALWDSKGRQLVLARDPMGIKPLYYWWAPSGTMVFASEVKAFLAIPSFRAKYDPASLRQFLEVGFIFDERRTSLQGVWKLPAGHLLRVTTEDAVRGRRPEPEPWFQPPRVERWDSTEKTADERADSLFSTLSAVVDQHLVADVPVAILLSGGLDSSVVTALARRRGPVHTIAMGFADSEVDERREARRVADALRTDHTEVLIHPEEIASTVAEAAWYVDDLFGDWGLVSTMLLYRKCREAGAKVVLVGEGSDELFGGYPDYVSAGGEESDRLPVVVRALRLYRWFSGRRWGWTLPEFVRIVREYSKQSGGDAFATVRMFETRRQLPVHYNMKVDKASMSASVEARVPFLDRRVAEEGYRTPRELLLRNGTNKWLLRRMAERHDLLPAETVSRPKFGASIATSWMEESPAFRQFAREVVLEGPLTVQLGLRRAMEDYFVRGRKGYPFPHPLSILPIVAWRLLMANLWARHYLVEGKAGGTMAAVRGADG
jgi:asparagine synthase (glutamine-hydrolysing)